MLNLEKEIKKDEVKLLSRYELKWEDKIKLDKIPVYVSCTRVYGVDRTMCRITIPCVNNHNKNFEKIHTSKFSTLSKTKYEIFLDEWNHKATESVVMNLPIRLIKGKNKNDRMYYMYELFLSPSVTLYGYFDNDDVTLLKLRQPSIKFIENNNPALVEPSVSDINPDGDFEL